jgi:hypothetical protein
MKQFFQKNKNNAWFWAFFILIFVLLFALPIMSLDSGNSGDEDLYQVPQGRNIVNYFKTDGADSTAITFFNLRFYGSSPDVIAEYWNQAFGVEDIAKTRHIFNSLYGWITILFAGLLAYLIGGWRAAVITVLLLFFSPRFIGHSFNNTKDIPFAAAVMAAIYFMTLFYKQFPKVKIYTFFFLILFIAFSISVRIGGILLYGYFGVFGLVYLIKKYRESKQKTYKLKIRNLGIQRLFLYGLGIVVVSYFVGLLLWPFALQAPIKNPLEAFREMSEFSISIRQVFEGAYQWSDALPKYYTLKYILMTVPVAIFIGLISFFILLWKDKKNYFYYFIVFFTFFFPIFWIFFSSGIVYHGWRHTLFSCAPMVIAAALGFNLLIERMEKFAQSKKIKSLYVNIVAIIVILLLLWNPIRHTIQNHPYEYVFFNKISGGIEKAYGNYELDYYYHSTREASEWIIAHAQKNGLETTDKIRVATWHAPSVNYFFRKDTADFTVTFSRWYERGNNDWDYAIFVVTGMAPEQIRGNYFPPQNTIHTIDVDGIPICLILKRENKADYEGSLLRAKVNESDLSMEEKYNYLQQSIDKYKEAIVYDPSNEVAISSLAELYLSINNLDSALFYINTLTDMYPIESYLSFASNIYKSAYERTKNQQYISMAINANERIVKNNPRSAKNQYDLAILYASIGNVSKGKTIMNNFSEKHRGKFQAHYYTAIYYAQTGNGNQAVELLEKCVKKFPKHEQECRDLIRQIQGK